MAPQTPLTPLADLARERGASLRPSERRVVDCLLELDPLHPDSTADAIAGSLGVSRATVVNTVQRLGYGGFAEFRRSLILERALAAQPPTAATEVPPAAGQPRAHTAPEHPALALARRVLDQERAA
ncbi:MAG TPA: hypothetical protein VFX49_06205, partial [Chloroflexota bacterium]|nr:hypothetical protein [Chloroflexota bacterium]